MKIAMILAASLYSLLLPFAVVGVLSYRHGFVKTIKGVVVGALISFAVPCMLWFLIPLLTSAATPFAVGLRMDPEIDPTFLSGQLLVGVLLYLLFELAGRWLGYKLLGKNAPLQTAYFVGTGGIGMLMSVICGLFLVVELLMSVWGIFDLLAKEEQAQSLFRIQSGPWYGPWTAVLFLWMAILADNCVAALMWVCHSRGQLRWAGAAFLWRLLGIGSLLVLFMTFSEPMYNAITVSNIALNVLLLLWIEHWVQNLTAAPAILEPGRVARPG